MEYEALYIQAGVPVLLSASVHDPEGGNLTYEWTVTPMIGDLVRAFPSNPTWFTPRAMDVARLVTITVSVSDDHGATSSAAMEITVLAGSQDGASPPDDRMGRLEFAMERMLAAPSQLDPSMTVEEKNPLAQAGLGLRHQVGKVFRPRL